MSKFRDFDEFFLESTKDSALSIKLFGKEYNLPAVIPASIMLETLRMARTGVKVMEERKQMEMAFAILGEENVIEWCEKGISMQKLGEIMKWATKEISENNNEQLDKKKLGNKKHK